MPKRKAVFCIGREPLSGCGVTLTAIEVRVHDTRCSHCDDAFEQRWRRWTLGEQDAEFDYLFGGAGQQKRRASRQR